MTYPGSELTTFSFKLLGSTPIIPQNRGWEKHFGQVPGRHLESDPHYPLMGSPVTPPTPSSVGSHLRGSQEVTPLSEFSSPVCALFYSNI